MTLTLREWFTKVVTMFLLAGGIAFAVMAVWAWKSDKRSGHASKGRPSWRDRSYDNSADWFNDAKARFPQRQA